MGWCVISVMTDATNPFPYLAIVSHHGPLTRYAKLRVAHALGMPGTFSPPPLVSAPDMHHGTCVTHVPWYMPESLTSGFLWSRWWVKRSRHSRRMRSPQFYVSGKRPMAFIPGNIFCFHCRYDNLGCLQWTQSFSDKIKLTHIKFRWTFMAQLFFRGSIPVDIAHIQGSFWVWLGQL